MARKPYLGGVTDDEWVFVAPYLALMGEDAPQRGHDVREVFNALRWMVRAGAPWRMMLNYLPPWHRVHQQAGRWIAAGVFELMVHDLRELPRVAWPGVERFAVVCCGWRRAASSGSNWLRSVSHWCCAGRCSCPHCP